MASAAPRRTIPAAFRAIDEAAYGGPAGQAGAPSHGQLGVRLVQNSRHLLGHLRRSWAHAFDLDSYPTVYEAVGCDLGPWPLEITPGCREVEWQLIADLVEDWVVVAYTVGARSPRPWDPQLWEGSAAVALAGGTGETVYEAITCPVRPGWMWCGLAVRQAELTAGGAAVRGNVLRRSYGEIQATAGFGVLGSPVQCVIRLTDGNGAAPPATPLSDWHQVMRQYTTSAAGDTVEVYPHLSDDEVRIQTSGKNPLGYELRPTGSLGLLSMAVAETVPTRLVR